MTAKMMLPISVTIIAKNEGSRIEDAIKSVQGFAREIVVVDSLSSDDTVIRATALGARVVEKAFQGFGQQKNFAQSLAQQEWVLNIDADERVSAETEEELRVLFTSPIIRQYDGFYLPRKTWYLNRWILHSGWYPNYLLRLARREKSKWTEPEIHEALQVAGSVTHLKNPLLHYSFPNQRSHILKNIEYANHAKLGLLKKGKTTHAFDLIVRPLWKFFDLYFIKRGFLDGMAGFFIAIHSAYALFLRYTYLYEETAQNSRSR
jgi:glycosyltransferase involved in cell wall biosynthesis